MHTRSLLPSAAVAAYVSSILVIAQDAPVKGFAIPLFANGAPTLVFHSAEAAGPKEKDARLRLYGQTIDPAALCFDGPFTLIAYFLHPHALKSLFSMDAADLTNDHIPLHDLKQTREHHLQERLLQATSLEGRLTLIDDFIRKLSLAAAFDYGRLTFATDALKQDTGPDALIRLRNQLNISERSLQRLFEQQIGISPKMFKRVWQFHASFQQLNRHQFSRLTDIAYEHGFADQSHFIRVFKEFTGLTPREYLQLIAPYRPEF